ncbi:pyridoxal-phosphate dependent enzyme [Streptomyces sp. NPDC001351]|uniref:threonine synthase n=1 Tax=Streptomyces sp. NPDC001351 TaxID=3364564 RepID=UPI0036A3A46A
MGAASLGTGGNPDDVYFDLLPIEFRESLVPGVMRRTPCRPAPRLGAAIGLPALWIKDETRQPTGSTKDRMAAVVIAVLREFGVREFVTASTGNSSSALARAARLAGDVRAHLFCGREFAHRHRFTPDEQVTLHIVDGSFVQAATVAQEFARSSGLLWEGGFFNWARREGLKLAYVEAVEQMTVEPAHVFQAVSSGMGVLGARKGLDELMALGRLRRMPSMHMVQQDTCAPMARGWAARRGELGDDDVVTDPTGLAASILRGDGRASYPYLADIATATGGDITSVTQSELTTARELLIRTENVHGCYASAATVAAAANLAAAGVIQQDEPVLLNITGANL